MSINLKKAVRLLTLLALTLTLAAPAAAETIVSAAASLTDAFKELGEAYKKVAPAEVVTFNFGASGALLKQMEQGAPVDVFASADQKTMDQAVEKKLIDVATRKNFVQNTLVLVVPIDSKLGLTGVKDLEKPEVARFSIGKPETVPVGRYSKDSLTAAGLWDKLQAKLIPGDNVRQVLDYVSRGEVDAGMVFGTDARIAAAKVKVVTEVGGHAPITYPIAVTASGAAKPAAKAFTDFVYGPTGQAILEKYGFKKP